MDIQPGSKIVGASGSTLVVDRIDDGVLICGERRIKQGAVVAVIEPPKLPIGTKVKLTVGVDKHIDDQTGKVVAILNPTLRRVRWQLWDDAIARNFQLSYLAEVAA